MANTCRQTGWIAIRRARAGVSGTTSGAARRPGRRDVQGGTTMINSHPGCCRKSYSPRSGQDRLEFVVPGP